MGICPILTKSLSDAIEELEDDIPETPIETEELKDTTANIMKRYPEISMELSRWKIPTLPAKEAERVFVKFNSNMPMVRKVWNEVRKSIPPKSKEEKMKYLWSKGYDVMDISQSLKITKNNVFDYCMKLRNEGVQG